MPVLDYGDLLAPNGQLRAQIAVRVVMAWPDPSDEASRHEYISTVTSMYLADLKAKAGSSASLPVAEAPEGTVGADHRHVEIKAVQEQMEKWFDEAGGHGSVSMAPGFSAFQNDFKKRLRSWLGAGAILGMVRRMATHHTDLPGGASVKKAIFILERTKYPLVPQNERDLRRAWVEYRSVAHFCAVLLDWITAVARLTNTPEELSAAVQDLMNEHFLLFLSEAEAYVEFGLAHKPQRTRSQTLLDPAETWVLPQDRPWPKSCNEPAPLNELLLKAAREYRAPMPSV